MKPNSYSYVRRLRLLFDPLFNVVNLRLVRSDRLQQKLRERTIYKATLDRLGLDSDNPSRLHDDQEKIVQERSALTEALIEALAETLAKVEAAERQIESSAQAEAAQAEQDDRDREVFLRPRSPNRSARGDIHVRTSFPVKGNDIYYCRAHVVSKSKLEKGALVSFEFFNEHGAKVRARAEGLDSSAVYPAYVYVAVGEPDTSGPILVGAFRAPEDAVQCSASLCRWNSLEEELTVHELDLQPMSSSLITGDLEDAEYSMHFLRSADSLLLKQGSVSARRLVLRRALLRNQSDAAVQRVTAIDSQLSELSTTWLPALPAIEPLPPLAAKRNHGMTICHLHKVSYPWENSGASIRNLNIVGSQLQSQLDPYVVTPLWYPDGDPRDGSGVWSEEIQGVEHYRITPPADRTRIDPSTQLTFDTYFTAGIVQTRGADIIHAASGVRGYELALKGLALAKSLGRPLVYEVRSFHEHTWRQPTPDVLEAELTQLRMAQENRCMQEADAVVTISYTMADALASRGICEEKITVIPNAVDLTRFSPSISPEKAKRALNLSRNLVVGYVSNMTWREGHDVLIKAIARLTTRWPTLHCLLVGDGAERANLEALTRELDLTNQVTFTGEVDHQSVKQYYEAMDVFVVPRRQDFAADYVTPMKPYEVMAIGRPLIMSDRPAAKEVVGNQERGLLFETGNSENLAAQIELLLTDENTRAKLVDVARDWIEKERTWDRVCQLYPGVYRQAMENYRKRHSC